MQRDIEQLNPSIAICLEISFPEKDYKQLLIERFQQKTSSSKCISYALNEMLEDQQIFSEVIRSSRLMCDLKAQGLERKVRVYLPLNLLIILNEIYQTELVPRDLIINQAFCLYAQRRRGR